MLVLTRRMGEAIQIGDDVEVVVTAVQGEQVRLGVRAPRHIPVVRSELLDQVTRENRAASQAPSLLPGAEQANARSPIDASLKAERRGADTGGDGAEKRRRSEPRFARAR